MTQDRRAQQAQQHPNGHSQPRRFSPSSPSRSADMPPTHDSQPLPNRAPLPFANGTGAHVRDDSWSLPPQSQSLRNTNALSIPSINSANGFSSTEQTPGNSSMAPIGTPSTTKRPATPTARAVIMGLPSGMTEDALTSMLVWAAKDIIEFDLDRGHAPDSLITASVYLRSLETAQLIHATLDGHQNTAKTSVMSVNVMWPKNSAIDSIASASREVSPTSSGAVTASTASTYANTPNTMPTPQSRFNIDSALNGLNRVTNEFQGAEADYDRGVRRAMGYSDEASHSHGTNGSASFPAAFGPGSPNEGFPRDMRMSGKSFIEHNSNDDETSALIHDPVAFAEHGPSVPRSRASTQIPIGAMDGLSLNTNIPPQDIPPASSSLTSPHGFAMSPPGNGHQSYMNGSSQATGSNWNSPYFTGRQMIPPSNPADQNAPCNTLYVGNLPLQTNEEELKAVFSKQRGYKRLCFRTKNNGPMCFVEFEDTSFATKTLKTLYGYPLHNSTKGGIRLSFSKNPLGVRNQHNGNQASMSGMHGAANVPSGFPSANGPPPGLSAPPGLGPVHQNQNAAVSNGNHAFYHQNGYGGPNNNSQWNGSSRDSFKSGGQTAQGGMNGMNGSHMPNGFGPKGADTPGPTSRASYGMPPPSRGASGHNTPNGYYPPHMMGR